MKWFLLSLILFCFSSLAQVVCRDPDNVGDAGSEAGAISSQCNEAVLAAAGGAVTRDENVQAIVNNTTELVDDIGEPLQPGTTESGK